MLYSVQAGFFVAFFGGGFASVLFAGLNARRLARIRHDLPLLLAGALFFGGFYLAAGHLAASGATLPLIGPLEDNARVTRYAGRALALAFFGLVYLRHRRFHRAAAVAAQVPPSPWMAAIACSAASVVLILVFGVVGALL